MSYDIPGFTRSYEAAGDLTTSQFKFVRLNGNVLAAQSALTDKVIGVLQNKPNLAGAASTVMISGVSKVRASTAISAGAPVYPAADGTASSVQGSGAVAVGIAEQTVAAGQLAMVLLKPLAAVV